MSLKSVSTCVVFLLVAAPLNLLHAAPPAVTVTDAAPFVVSISAAEAVSVDCNGTFVRVTVDAVPTTYTTTCANVTSLTVTATGTFDNTIDVQGVAVASFTSLASLTVNAGAGADTVNGSPFGDEINGEDGADILNGLGGADVISGGQGADTIRGGIGNDTLSGGTEGDTFNWLPGEGTDIVSGDAGSDTELVTGAAVAEVYTFSVIGSNLVLVRTSPTAFSITMSGIENVQLNTDAGDDSVTLQNLPGLASPVTLDVFLGANNDTLVASAQVSAGVTLHVDGGANDDNITGSSLADTIDGGLGNDTIVGGPGLDSLLGGAGVDVFTWNPGDGSDNIDAGTEADTLVFNGAAANETFNITQQGGGFQLLRDVGNIVMGVQNVETLTLNGLGGDDIVNTVGLTATAQSIDGGAQNIVDTINFNAAGACVATTPFGTFSGLGFQTVTFTNFEVPNVSNPCVGVPSMDARGIAVLAFALAMIGAVTLRTRQQTA